jgi:hypothetical protein
LEFALSSLATAFDE